MMYEYLSINMHRTEHTNFCSTRKLAQANKFLGSETIFPASPLKTNFCNDSAVPAHRNVLSLASSSTLNNSLEETGSMGGLP